MNILFSAGGTLGHINPALSFIKALKNHYKDINITFIATTKEKDLEILKTNLIDKTLKENYFSEMYGNKYYEHSVAKHIGYIRENLERRRSELTEKAEDGAAGPD